MPSTAKKSTVLTYKGRPLIRKDNVIYYGSMSDSHIIMLQILDAAENQDLQIAKRVSVQLQQINPNTKSRERVKKTEKSSLWTAMDIASIWLTRALNAK